MKKRRAWIGIYAVAVVLLAVLIYVVPSVLGLFDRTYITEYGEVRVESDIDAAWIIRDESVYTANEGRKIERIADSGSLVRGKSTVVKLSGSGTSMTAKYTTLTSKLGDAVIITEDGKTEQSGYVSYTSDGNEAALSPDTMDALTEEDLEDIGNNYLELPEDACAKGEPIFRVTKNGSWWMVFFADEKEAAKYTAGSEVTVTLDDQDLDAVVRSVDAEGDRTRIILTCKEYHPSYLGERSVSLHIVAESASGLLIRTKSIVEVDGQQGVLVRNKNGNDSFVPIQIKASDGETAAVYEDIYMDENSEFVETVKNYDEIVSSPGKAELEEIQKETEEE